MRTGIVLLLIIFLSSCMAKKDIEAKEFSGTALKEDLRILKGIITDLHAGAYAYNTPAQLNALFDSIRGTINSPLNLRAFYNKVNYIEDRLRCIHTDVYLPNEYYDSISNRPMFFPIAVTEIDQKMYVNCDACSIPLGAEIVAINNTPAKDIITKLHVYTHTDGYSDPVRQTAISENFAYDYFMAYGSSKDFYVQYREDSSTVIKYISIPPEKLQEIYDGNFGGTSFEYRRDVDYDFTIDEDAAATAILTVRTFSYGSTHAKNVYRHFMKGCFRQIRQNNIKNLIVDIRNNGGGTYDVTYLLLSYLVDNKLPEFDSAVQRFRLLSYKDYVAPRDTADIEDEDNAYLKCDRLDKFCYRLKQDQIDEWEPKTDGFRGKIFVLINSADISAAATFAAVLKGRPNVYMIGEETGGGTYAHNARVMSFILPNTGLRISVPLARYYQPQFRKIKSDRGVMPDKYIPFTVQDLIENTDRPMTYLFDSILNKK